MPSPFPGMDPYLENPELWPDVHNRLIAALGDELSPRLRPNYYVALEERTYAEEPGELILVGQALKPPVGAEVRETFLEVRKAGEGEVVTVLELLSPANKRSGTGRRMYLDKRELILSTRTSLLELDLLRAGEPMPTVRPRVRSDYSVLVSRGHRRPKADLIPFGVRDPIPPFPLPLRRGEDEPAVDLGNILHALYDRASYDLRIDYELEPTPPLSPADSEWARALIRERGAESDR